MTYLSQQQTRVRQSSRFNIISDAQDLDKSNWWSLTLPDHRDFADLEFYLVGANRQPGTNQWSFVVFWLLNPLTDRLPVRLPTLQERFLTISQQIVYGLDSSLMIMPHHVVSSWDRWPLSFMLYWTVWTFRYLKGHRSKKIHKSKTFQWLQDTVSTIVEKSRASQDQNLVEMTVRDMKMWGG